PTDGRECTILGGHHGQITGLAFAPGGQWIASSSLDRTVKLWSTAGVHESTAFADRGPVYAGTIARDSKSVYLGGEDAVVRALDLATGRERKGFFGHTGRIHALALSADGQTLASASEDETIRLWDNAGEPLYVLKGHEGAVTGVAFLPDAKSVASV